MNVSPYHGSIVAEHENTGERTSENTPSAQPSNFHGYEPHPCSAGFLPKVLPHDKVLETHFLGTIAQDGVECELRQFRVLGVAR